MKTSDSERRAFLRSLKPGIVEIQARAAERAGQRPTDEVEADVAAGIAEYRAAQPKRKRFTHLQEG